MAGPLLSKLDGVDDRAVRSTALVGASPGSVWTGSFWFVRTNLETDLLWSAPDDRVSIRLMSSTSQHRARIITKDATPAQNVRFDTDKQFSTTGLLYHLCFSIDNVTPANTWVRVDGGGLDAFTTSGAQTSNNTDFAHTVSSLAAFQTGASNFFSGEIAQFALWYNLFVPSGEYTKLIAPAAINSIDYGSDGSKTTGQAATVLFNRETGSSDPDDLVTNKGTGGAFVLEGGGLAEGTLAVPDYAAESGNAAVLVGL